MTPITAPESPSNTLSRTTTPVTCRLVMPTARRSPSVRRFSSTFIVTVLATPRLPTRNPSPRIAHSEPTTPLTIPSTKRFTSLKLRRSIPRSSAIAWSGPRNPAASPGFAVTRITSADSSPNSRLAASRRRISDAPPEV